MRISTRIAAVCALLSLGAEATPETEKPVTYTVEQILQAVPKDKEPVGKGKWTEEQTRAYQEAIAAVLTDRTVTLKELTVSRVKPPNPEAFVEASSGRKVVGPLDVELTCQVTLPPEEAAKLKPKQPVTLTGVVGTATVFIANEKNAKGHKADIKVKLAFRSMTIGE